MKIISIILVYAAIALFQIPGMARKKYRRELTVFSLFLLIAFVFSLLLGLGIKIPSPLKFIQYEIQDRFNLHY